MVILNWLILLLGLIFNILVFYWNENLRNGFRTSTPFYFVKHAGLYAFIDIILFFLILFLLQIPWYVIIIFYIFSVIMGVALSEKRYKKILNEVIDDEEKNEGRKFTKDEREEKLKIFYKAQKNNRKTK